ncbi:hypothetical protein [Micromonospora sp. RP3T]|uniref:hypothetical protein n=1 Tax=Micromonospora sp. RP3T TaxID=2135446 RepID=UPI000D17CA13|nr:hypothetical protein [Micromonospora sp. RP3T]PTA46807.1 hypothetical protein C8054_08765 [Micromonospora sp. RP3T]
MSYAELTLSAWWSLSDEDARRTAAAIARGVDARLVGVGSHAYAGRSGRVAFFERDGLRYALVPGGAVRLGFDADRFTAGDRLRADFATAAAEYDLPGPVDRFLSAVTSPPRRASLPARLVAVRSVDADELLATDDEADEVDDHAGLTAGLHRRGLRPPTPDEWEHSCAAGATGLFRWGDEYPETGPYGELPLIREPNLFGLVIGDDPYRAEFTTDPVVLCGGDGGSALCGGYGSFLSWLTLATAYRDPDLAEALHEGGLIGETPVRPVLAIP